MSLSHLISIDLPIRVSFDVARLSNTIDEYVKAFAKVRDALIKNYKIKLSLVGKDGTTKFSTSIGEDRNDEVSKEQREKALVEFSTKINELIDVETEDIQITLDLPTNIAIKPEILKPLLPFIKVGEISGR